LSRACKPMTWSDLTGFVTRLWLDSTKSWLDLRNLDVSDSTKMTWARRVALRTCILKYSFWNWMWKTQISSSPAKTRSKSMITVWKYSTISNRNNVFNVLCATGLSVKSKMLSITLYKVEHVILKMCHKTTRRHSKRRKFAPVLIITEAKETHFFLWKRSELVNLKLGDFENMTLTRVSSHWLWL